MVFCFVLFFFCSSALPLPLYKQLPSMFCGSVSCRANEQFELGKFPIEQSQVVQRQSKYVLFWDHCLKQSKTRNQRQTTVVPIATSDKYPLCSIQDDTETFTCMNYVFRALAPEHTFFFSRLDARNWIRKGWLNSVFYAFCFFFFHFIMYFFKESLSFLIVQTPTFGISIIFVLLFKMFFFFFLGGGSSKWRVTEWLLPYRLATAPEFWFYNCSIRELNLSDLLWDSPCST